MPTTEAHLGTDRAGRYLGQLCSHLDQMTRMGGHGPFGGHRARHGAARVQPKLQHVEWTETSGTVRFTDGQLTLRATADSLVLRVEADTEDAVRRLQDAIAARVEKIGRRDGLRVTWQRFQTPAPPGAGGDGTAS